jgi:hypothetical protein
MIIALKERILSFVAYRRGELRVLQHLRQWSRTEDLYKWIVIKERQMKYLIWHILDPKLKYLSFPIFLFSLDP